MFNMFVLVERHESPYINARGKMVLLDVYNGNGPNCYIGRRNLVNGRPREKPCNWRGCVRYARLAVRAGAQTNHSRFL